mgnify:CR=1 FL=1
MTGSVLIAQQDGVRTLTLNRPEALNALTVESTRSSSASPRRISPRGCGRSSSAARPASPGNNPLTLILSPKGERVG